MRFLFFCFSFFYFTTIQAQKRCEYDVEVNDSIGSLKTTKEFLMYEKRFGNNENYVFFSLSNDNGVPILNFQLIHKNNDFVKAYCIDAKTKLYLQLEIGTIVSMLHPNVENCGSFMRNDERNVRLLSANFLFMKNNYEELKKSPVVSIRVKYTTETVDYIIRKELQSELLNQFSRPQNYFMDYLHCVEN